MWKFVKRIFFGTVGFIDLVALCAVDSESWIPFIIFCICSSILGLWAWWNDWFADYEYEED